MKGLKEIGTLFVLCMEEVEKVKGMSIIALQDLFSAKWKDWQ